MALIKPSYSATSTAAITCTVNSLATSATLLVGRASTQIDNSSNLDLDALVSGQFTVSATAPTLNTTIEVWAYAPRSLAAGAATYPLSITGTDAALTIASANMKANAMRLVATIVVDATVSVAYDFPPTSIANLFGGVLPYKWGLFVTNGTGQTLAASGNALQYERLQGQTV